MGVLESIPHREGGLLYFLTLITLESDGKNLNAVFFPIGYSAVSETEDIIIYWLKCF